MKIFIPRVECLSTIWPCWAQLLWSEWHSAHWRSYDRNSISNLPQFDDMITFGSACWILVHNSLDAKPIRNHNEMEFFKWKQQSKNGISIETTRETRDWNNLYANWNLKWRIKPPGHITSNNRVFPCECSAKVRYVSLLIHSKFPIWLRMLI